MIAALLLAAALAPEMALIPESDCPMGDTLSHREAHRARVPAFWIARTPVTNAAYLRFVEATGHAPPEGNSVGGSARLWNGRRFPAEIADHPVVNVSWHDAAAYAKWLAAETGTAFRLPAEEEWEVAARGGLKGKAYPWGDEIDKAIAWFGMKWIGAATLMPADYGRANAFGLYGMAGNVWQWVHDWYVPIFDDRPVAEELETFRVIRGGSWANEEAFLKVNYRGFHPPAFKDFFIGFRVAAEK